MRWLCWLCLLISCIAAQAVLKDMDAKMRKRVRVLQSQQMVQNGG